MVKLGLQARLFRNTGDYAAPVWQHVRACREGTLSLERAEAEATTRGNAGFRATAVALKDATVEVELAYCPPDSDVDALIAAMTGGTSLDLLVADGDGIGGQGLRADWIVQAIERGEPLEEAQRLRLTLKTDSQTHAPQWYTSTSMLGWAHYKEITVRPDNVNATLLDFPLHVPIEADADIGASARADGLDIRFTNADGTQELSFERESFAIIDGNAEGRFWVKVPTIDPDTGATIRIYYGNPNATDASDPDSTWDSDYIWVSHMADLTPSVVRASRGQNGVKKDSTHPSETTGLIGRAQDFCSGSYLDCGDLTPAAWTLELLFKGASSSNGVLMHWGDIYSSVYLPFNESISILMGECNWRNWPITVTNQVCDGNWHHLAFSISGNDQFDIDNSAFYLDGNAQFPEYTDNTGQQQAKSGNLTLGYLTDYSETTGIYDEVRISQVQRSEGWIKFAAINLTSTDHELTWGAEQ